MCAKWVARRRESVRIGLQDFLEEQGLYQAARAVEKESLVMRNTWGSDLCALRSLILDGRWEDVEAVLRPLHGQPKIDTSRVLFAVRKERFLELFQGHVSGLGLLRGEV
jgi:hypothetical protein